SRDLARAYEARALGCAPEFGELVVQYADYALWQREWLGNEGDPKSVLGRQLAFWREALAGAPEGLTLPVDHPRPPTASYRGGRVDVELSAALHAALAGLGRMQGASLFMVLQAGLSALLTKLGAGDDVVVGAPVAGRGDGATEGLVGFFVNT